MSDCTLTLSRGRAYAGLKSVVGFMCQDATRFHLCGVKIERVDCGGKVAHLRFIATDGHTLARAGVPTTEIANAPAFPDKGVIVSAESVAEALRTLKHRKAEADMPVSLVFSGKTVSLAAASSSVQLKTVDADFPPYEQVIPKYTKPGALSVGLNPRYLTRACDAVVAFAGHDGDTDSRGIRFTHGGELDPVRLDFESPDCGEFVAVIMPMRMS